MANSFNYQFPPDDGLTTIPLGNLGLDFGLSDQDLFGDDQLPRGVQIGGGRRREEEMLDQNLTPTKLRPKINGTRALAEAIPPTKDGKTFVDRVSEHRREIEQPDPSVPARTYHSPLHLPQSLPLHHSRTPSASSQMSMCLDPNLEFAAAQSSQGYMPMGYGMQHSSQSPYPYQSAQLAPHGAVSPNPPSPMMHGSYPGVHPPPLAGPGGYTLPSAGYHGLGIPGQPQYEPFTSGFHSQQLQVSPYAHPSRHPSPMSMNGQFYPPMAANSQNSPPLPPPASPCPPTIQIQTATPLKPAAAANTTPVTDISPSKGRGGHDDAGIDSDVDIHPFSDDDDDDDDDDKGPDNDTNHDVIPGTSKSPGGRPSKAKQKIVAGYVEAIQKLAREASSKSGLSTSFVITQALDPNDPRFGNCWNTWQRGYFEEFREEELKRVDPSIRPLPGQSASPRVIRLTYQGFMEQHGAAGKKILRAWDALKRFQKSNMTVQQRIGLFNRENRKIKQIMDNLAATFNFQSALISTGGVVNQDQGICTTYETTMAEGFLQSLVKNKDEEVVRGLFRSHVYGKVAQQHLEGLDNTHGPDSHLSTSSTSKRLKGRAASKTGFNEKDARHPSVSNSSNAHNGDNHPDSTGTTSKKMQENVIRDCLLGLFGSKSSLKRHIHPNYMWRALGGQLAHEERRLTLYNWPEGVEFPTDGTNNKGLADLTVEKRAALFKATNHPTFPLSKRGWPKEGTRRNTPVIQCVPPAEGRALCLYADGTTANDGQTLEELRSNQPAPPRVIASTMSEPESSDDVGPKKSTSAKSKSKAGNRGGKAKAKGSQVKVKSEPTPATPLKTTTKRGPVHQQSESDSSDESDMAVDSDSKCAASPTRSSPSQRSSPFASSPSHRSSPFASSPSRRSSPSRSSPSRYSPLPSPGPNVVNTPTKPKVTDSPTKPKCGPAQAVSDTRLKPEVVLTRRHVSQRQNPLRPAQHQERNADDTSDKKRERSTDDASDKRRDRRVNRHGGIDQGGSDVEDEKRTKRSRTESSTSGTAQLSDDNRHKNACGTLRVSDYGPQFQPQGPPRHYPPYVDYTHHPAHPAMHSFPPTHMQAPASSRSPAFYYQNPYVPHGPYPPHYGSPYPAYPTNYGPPPSHAGSSTQHNAESEYQQGNRGRNV